MELGLDKLWSNDDLPHSAQLRMIRVYFQKRFNDNGGSVYHFHCAKGAADCDKCKQEYKRYDWLKTAQMIEPLGTVASGKGQATPERDAKRQRGEMDILRGGILRDVRTSQDDYGACEFKTVRTKRGPPEWVAESELEPRMVEHYVAKRDVNDKYKAHSKHDARQRGKKIKIEKIQYKRLFNRLHCEVVQQLLGLYLLAANTLPLHHITLAHWSEWLTPAALLKLGIPCECIHIPQPFAYAHCCGKGFPNIYDCLLSELPARLAGLVVSAFADFTGYWKETTTKDEIATFLKAVLKGGDYFALSMTVSQYRGEKTAQDKDMPKPWWNEVSPFVHRIIKQCGYDFYDPIAHPLWGHYKVGNDAEMYFFSWLFVRTKKVPIVVDLTDELCESDTLSSTDQVNGTQRRG